MLVAELCLTLLGPHGLLLTRLSPWNSAGKNTEVGSHCLLQGIFPVLSLLHCRQILYHLSLLITSKNDT